MGFSKRTIIAALEQLSIEGLPLGLWGIRVMRLAACPVILRWIASIYRRRSVTKIIMHNKFFIIDERFVVTGTGNITTTGFGKNDNNWVLIDSPEVADDFQAEFDQMFDGRFGYAKDTIDNNNTYTVGDTKVEVYFSQEDHGAHS